MVVIGQNPILTDIALFRHLTKKALGLFEVLVIQKRSNKAKSYSQSYNTFPTLSQPLTESQA